MGRDNQPKERQLRRQSAKEANRASYARILIVTEGSKTEPQYLEEIRAAHQLHSANVEVQPSQLGTEPLQVVQYARDLFMNGDLHKGIRPKSFDQVYVVFDRDAHLSYFNALSLAQSLGGKLRNDENQKISFKSIASIPCFELWLLLHFEDVLSPMHRNDVIKNLTRYLPAYSKGNSGMFTATQSRLEIAMQRAKALAKNFTAYSDPEPFTALHELVESLVKLRD